MTVPPLCRLLMDKAAPQTSSSLLADPETGASVGAALDQGGAWVPWSHPRLSACLSLRAFAEEHSFPRPVWPGASNWWLPITETCPPAAPVGRATLPLKAPLWTSRVASVAAPGGADVPCFPRLTAASLPSLPLYSLLVMTLVIGLKYSFVHSPNYAQFHC